MNQDPIIQRQERHLQNLRVLVEIMIWSTAGTFFGSDPEVLQKTQDSVDLQMKTLNNHGYTAIEQHLGGPDADYARPTWLP